MNKAIYFSLGCLAFGLGALGMFLPLLPTTCFWLLAAWAFSKSSDRFYKKLTQHKSFGPIYQNWQQNKSIPAKVKWFALSSIAISMILSFYLHHGHATLQAIAIASMLLVTIYLISLPTTDKLVAQKI